MDSLEEQLEGAGRLHTAHNDEQGVLRDLLASRAAEARDRRRRRLLPPMVVGGALAVVGAGAAVATQWGPWNYVPDADIVIARDWTDVEGKALGSCESRMALGDLPAEAREEALAYLETIDVDSLEPDPERVAGVLVAVDRPGDLGRLIAGADVSDFDINHTGPTWDQASFSDARILQGALQETVFAGMVNHVEATWRPQLDAIQSRVETHCTTEFTDIGQP